MSGLRERGFNKTRDTEDEDHAGEEGVTENYANVDHLFNRGHFNQKNVNGRKVDTSNEETRSSWSSSEEALAACEGAVANLPLDGATRCTTQSHGHCASGATRTRRLSRWRLT